MVRRVESSDIPARGNKRIIARSQKRMARAREGEAGKRSLRGGGETRPVSEWVGGCLSLPRCLGLPGGFPSFRRLRLGPGARFSLPWWPGIG